MRGTIWFEGYAECISAMNDLQLLDESIKVPDANFNPLSWIN